MIENHRVLEIIRLIDSRQYSQRQISALLKVSRGTVSSIVKGIRKFRVKIAQEINIKPNGPVVRCPQCGGKTQLPCTFCEIKKIIGSSYLASEWGLTTPDTQPLEIQLTPKHHERYIQIRSWREQQLNPYYAVLPDNWPWRKEQVDTSATTTENQTDTTHNSNEVFSADKIKADTTKSKPNSVRIEKFSPV